MVDVVDQQLGPEDKVKVSFVGGKLVITNSYQGKQIGVDLAITADAKAFLEELKLVLPASWGFVVNVVEGALP